MRGSYNLYYFKTPIIIVIKKMIAIPNKYAHKIIPSTFTAFFSLLETGNDKYRRVVWQCNHKFKDKTRCKTPHLTEDEIKAAFVRMVNKLYADREFYITELTAIKNRLGDTTALEKERRILDEQLGIDAKAVNDLIARNARVAQDQKEYNERYDALVNRYEETEHKRDAVMEQIDQIMIRRRKIERFIDSVKGLPEFITEFDESLWAGLVDSLTVHSKDRIVFRLTCGMEIEV